MQNQLFLIAVFVLSVTLQNPNAEADLLWDGGGDGFSVFQEANWLNTVTGMDPLAGTVDPSVDVLFNARIDGDVVAGGGGGANQFELGAGFSLTLNDTVFWNSQSSTGIGGVPGDSTETVFFNDDSGGGLRFVFELEVVLNDNASLTLRGGGNPVNRSTIDFRSLDAELWFDNESVDAVVFEHFNNDKFTVFGRPAEVGSNLRIEDINGRTRVQAIPEPSSCVLLFIIGAGCVRRRMRN